MGYTVVIREKWVPCDEGTINKVFGLMKVDSEKFRALYKEPNYDLILQELTDGSKQWSINVNQEVMAFPRTGLTEVAKIWFYFVSSKLVPSKHLSMIERDKALLPYSIVKGYKFNVGKVNEILILESVYHKVITHPSLITKLCELAEVPIKDNEEKCPPMQPLHFPL